MAVGLQPSKQEIDTQAGIIARDFQAALTRAKSFQFFLSGKTDEDLAALGYTADDILVLRGTFDDIAQLYAIAAGQVTLTVKKNFTENIRKVFGMGAL